MSEPIEQPPISPGVPEWHQLRENRWNLHAWIVGEPIIGENTWIGAFTVIDGSGGLQIGRACDISAGAHIYTHSTVRRALSDGALPIDRGTTTIGDCVHVGAHATVLMGCTIGDHCIVAAGAVVLEGTTAPAWSLIVGVPARVVPDGARKAVRSDSAEEARG